MLREAVRFGGHSYDIAEWYRAKPGIILSTSDHEGTHQAIAEGGAAGCVPVIFPWAGAEAVYDDRWVVEGVRDAADRIRRYSSDPALFLEESERAQAFMRERFSPEEIGAQILAVVEGRR